MRPDRLLLLFLVLLLATTGALSRPISQSLADSGAAASETSFKYRFENPRFFIRVIEIDLGPSGAGELRFTRGESDEVLDLKVKVMPATIGRITTLFEVSRFLTSKTDYQDARDFSHLGWITLAARRGSLERKVRFNYTKNAEMTELEDIFRAIASQEIALFDIENAERYQPLDLPKQLETLENELKLARFAEPERLLGKLNEIAGDDTQSLIARNQARRIIENIKKGKFGSPVKKK
ncbi:MAG TPA: hypothetical protein VLM38_15220 [Blastocatellia bacterium]|nr:hypothetical protein [Blastocatellia bacterium]